MNTRPVNPPVARSSRRRRVALACAALGLLSLAVCEGDKGDPGPPGEPAPIPIPPEEPLPGLAVEIVSLAGATGGGSFRSGDAITVTFTVHDDAGNPFELAELDRGTAMVSGPTFNYQRVIASQSDVLTRAVKVGEGRYSYTFASRLPSEYLAPLNDSANFSLGELTGQPLLAGTYTVGLELRKTYEIGGESIRDPGNATMGFLLGGASAVESREVVTLANCNQCHGQLRAHGSNRDRIENCLLCHTSGSEDRNDASVEGGTPNVTIDFKVMIHKIHAGRHLGSVLGITTNPDGTRNYAATPQPYRVVGNSVSDFSEVGFPRWPSSSQPMPRDTGFTALSGAEQSLENSQRAQPVDCGACHGDPDGTGPLPPPAQGDLIWSQPSRMACGSCHDDWVWDRPYTANMQTMPAQLDDSACILCHRVEGSSLAVKDAHLHPLLDAAQTPGTNVDLQAVAEAGVHDGDGTIDPGEKVELRFTVEDDGGNAIDPAQLTRLDVAMTGPTSNPNQLLWTSLPLAALTAGPGHVTLLPEPVLYEFAGDATAALGDVFTTARTPHWNVAGAVTAVFVRSAVGVTSMLAAAAPALQNYLDVTPGTGSSFARDDFIVIENGVAGKEEYLRVQFVEGDRIWFSSPASSAYSPGVRFAHAIGAQVRVVTLTALTEGVHYALNAATGTITELAEFVSGNAVVVNYTTDFVMPSVYGGTVNESPVLDESWGGWLGKSIVDGTYTVAIWGSRSVTVNAFGEITSYTDAAATATRDVLVGSASALEPNTRIDSAATCQSCHVQLEAHGGGRQGYEGCLMCHGLAGAEDRPPYVAANAPLNDVTIDFRTMLHKIHHGKNLANAQDYAVVGFGSGYPNNFSLHSYAGVGFPYLPGSTAQCTSCHGVDNTAWMEPQSRDHPTQQLLPVRAWRAVCGSCHDAPAQIAHIDANTSPSGAESCSICHGAGQEVNVPLVHTSR